MTAAWPVPTLIAEFSTAEVLFAYPVVLSLFLAMLLPDLLQVLFHFVQLCGSFPKDTMPHFIVSYLV